MQIAWASHLPKEEQEDFKKYVRGSVAILDRLSDIIQKKVEAADNSRISVDAYGIPNWSEKQADSCGYLRAMKEIQELINLEG